MQRKSTSGLVKVLKSLSGSSAHAPGRQSRAVDIDDVPHRDWPEVSVRHPHYVTTPLARSRLKVRRHAPVISSHWGKAILTGTTWFLLD